jgi:hypothetical protein
MLAVWCYGHLNAVYSTLRRAARCQALHSFAVWFLTVLMQHDEMPGGQAGKQAVRQVSVRGVIDRKQAYVF